MQQEENADENFKTHRIIVNNFQIFLIDASFSSIICSKKKNTERNWKWPFKVAGDREVKTLLSGRKIHWNRSCGDNAPLIIPHRFKKGVSVGTQAYTRGHKIFPEWDVNLTPFILPLKSLSDFFPLPQIPDLWHGVRGGWGAGRGLSASIHHRGLPPCRPAPIPATTNCLRFANRLCCLRTPAPAWLRPR